MPGITSFFIYNLPLHMIDWLYNQESNQLYFWFNQYQFFFGFNNESEIFDNLSSCVLVLWRVLRRVSEYNMVNKSESNSSIVVVQQ